MQCAELSEGASANESSHTSKESSWKNQEAKPFRCSEERSPSGCRVLERRSIHDAGCSGSAQRLKVQRGQAVQLFDVEESAGHVALLENWFVMMCTKWSSTIRDTHSYRVSMT